MARTMKTKSRGIKDIVLIITHIMQMLETLNNNANIFKGIIIGQTLWIRLETVKILKWEMQHEIHNLMDGLNRQS